MKVLVDTNILTRLAEPGHVMHEPAAQAIRRLAAQGHTLHIVPQNLYEFWVVSTRPTSVNGLGKSGQEAASELVGLKSLFSFLDDRAEVYPTWEQLVTDTPILGKNAHDARLVAAMMVHGIQHLLTFNARDFQTYSGVISMSPTTIV